MCTHSNFMIHREKCEDCQVIYLNIILASLKNLDEMFGRIINKLCDTV